MSYYTEDEIERIRSEIVEYGLDAPKAMLNADASTLQEACNGIGAEWLSKTSRKVITRVLHYAECSAAVHDWHYHNSNGDDTTREDVDELFLSNGLREVRSKFPQWWNWRRLLGERAVLAAFEVLRRVGAKAWNDALAERFKRVCAQRGITPDDFFNLEKESENNNETNT